MIGDLFAGDIAITPYRNSTKAASGTYIFVELFGVTNLMLQLLPPSSFFFFFDTWDIYMGGG
jgi:hypothetical protein